MPSAGDNPVVVDDLGANLAMDVPINRIVSLAPVLTDLLFAVGLGERVVGRTEWGGYPPEALDVVSVGAGLAPNVEVVASRRPDLVLFYRSSANAPALAQLENMSIASGSFRVDSLGDVPRVARIIGGVVGAGDLADSLASAFDQELALARERATKYSDECTAVIVVWDSPPMVIGSGSFLSELIALAGVRNVFDDVRGPDAEVSIETIAARNPDIVVAIGETIPNYAGRREWNVIEAVRDQRFVLISGTQFEYPSFRSFEAAGELREKVGDCDLE